MLDIIKQIENIEKEIRETPYHKGTEHHIGMLRARIARLKDKMIESEKGAHLRKSSGKKGGYAVKKQGDATIVLVGPPSVGKSTLLNLLTNAKSKIAPYAFTTVTVIPGMMEYNNARLQILDVPGLIEGAEEGRGRGREVLSVIRGCDLALIISEPSKKHAFTQIVEALERNGIRVNKSQPNIDVVKKLDGGINIFSNIKQVLSKETIKAIAIEMGIKNADVKIKQQVNGSDLIDAFSRNRVYIPALYIINKADLSPKHSPSEILSNSTEIYISALNNNGINILKEKIWEKLNFINIYLVRRDENPSNSNPVIVRQGEKLIDVAQKIGERFADEIDHAVIWGPGSKFPGQEVSLSTQAVDGMQVRFV